jgi:hypothetical protein
MVGSTLGVYRFGLIFVSARTNKRHHHHQPRMLGSTLGVYSFGLIFVLQEQINDIIIICLISPGGDIT